MTPRPDPPGLLLDRSGVVRPVVPVSRWDDLVDPAFVDPAFTEIEVRGASSPQVSGRPMAVSDDLSGVGPPERDRIVSHHRHRLGTVVEQGSSFRKGQMPRPDPRGLA